MRSPHSSVRQVSKALLPSGSPCTVQQCHGLELSRSVRRRRRLRGVWCRGEILPLTSCCPCDIAFLLFEPLRHMHRLETALEIALPNNKRTQHASKHVCITAMSDISIAQATTDALSAAQAPLTALACPCKPHTTCCPAPAGWPTTRAFVNAACPCANHVTCCGGGVQVSFSLSSLPT